MPPLQAFEAIAYGIVYANWPIMWIVVNAMYLYNITIRSGVFHLFRKWMITNTPPDKRVILLIISFCFGSLLEGVAGFGVPGAICSSLLVSLGQVIKAQFEPLDAIVYTLIFNTTPVAFGSLGIPVATLASLTGLPLMSLSAMMGRQLPFVSVFLPVYTLTIYAGFREGLVECWPVAMVSGVVFATVQAVFANWVGPELPDLIAGLLSLICTMGFVQYWKPPHQLKYKATMSPLFVNNESISCTVKQNEKMDNQTALNNDNQKIVSLASSDDSNKLLCTKKGTMMAEYRGNPVSQSLVSSSGDIARKNDGSIQQIDAKSHNSVATAIKSADQVVEKANWKEAGLAWSPWIFVVVVVMIWSFAKVSNVGQLNVEWPHLHQRVWLTLYGKRYDAIWGFQPLAIGTAILVSTIPFSALVILHGAHPRIFPIALRDTATQLYKPTFTVSLIMAFAYLLNYSGIVYTIGYQLSSVGGAFPFLSAWLGWIACFLSGSDTSANSLFGNLQVVAAREIGLSTILMAATNSAGAITSKMVSPQNLTTGVSTIGLQGKEGQILRRTIIHSVIAYFDIIELINFVNAAAQRLIKYQRSSAYYNNDHWLIKLDFKSYIKKQKVTLEIAKILFQESNKYNKDSSIGEKKQTSTLTNGLHLIPKTRPLIHLQTGSKCKQLKFTNLNAAGSKRKLHAVLKCNSCNTVWNRDVMVLINIYYIMLYMSQHNNERPPEFARPSNTTEIKLIATDNHYQPLYQNTIQTSNSSDITVGELLLKYQDNSQLLNRILAAKAEEDKRRTAEEWRQAEEARLQTKFIEYEMNQRQEGSSSKTGDDFTQSVDGFLIRHQQYDSLDFEHPYFNPSLDRQSSQLLTSHQLNSLQARLDACPLPGTLMSEYPFLKNQETASATSPSPSIDVLSPSAFDMYHHQQTMSCSPPDMDDLALYPSLNTIATLKTAPVIPSNLPAGNSTGNRIKHTKSESHSPILSNPCQLQQQNKPKSIRSANIHRTLSYESVMNLDDLNTTKKSGPFPPATAPPAQPLDHDKVMEALRAKLRRASSPYQNTKPKLLSEPIPPPNTYPTTGVLLLNLKSRRHKSSVKKRCNGSGNSS
ncbi:hypothetical protein [Parasitella parasitica]|uniref:Lactate permease n=1 Tax=Parasitella parasitica TaxID=35722 RepID=A0A0B7NQ49_9FUNG|nr:hypothetical protein [Parasitella parasitica]